jgi:hypothetical protein
MVQLALAFAVAVKHYLRGEEGMYVENLTVLIIACTRTCTTWSVSSPLSISRPASPAIPTHTTRLGYPVHVLRIMLGERLAQRASTSPPRHPHRNFAHVLTSIPLTILLGSVGPRLSFSVFLSPLGRDSKLQVVKPGAPR